MTMTPGCQQQFEGHRFRASLQIFRFTRLTPLFDQDLRRGLKTRASGKSRMLVTTISGTMYEPL